MKVFISMRFKGRNEKQVKLTLEKIENQLGYIYPNQKFDLVCNYWYEAPKNGNKKLHELGNAVSLMADCDLFIYVTRDGSEEKPVGCAVECFLWQKCIEKSWGIYFENEDLVMITC